MPGEAEPREAEPRQSWLTKFRVEIAVALVSATAPVTAFVAKSRDIELARQKQAYEMATNTLSQKHKIQMDFLEKVVTANRDNDPYYKRDVLNFFASVMDDSALRSWAKSEFKRIDEEIKKIESIKATQAGVLEKLAEVERQAEDTETEVTLLGQGPIQKAGPNTDELQRLKTERAGFEADIQKLQSHVQELETKLQLREHSMQGGRCPTKSVIAYSPNQDVSEKDALAACVRSRRRLGSWTALVPGTDRNPSRVIQCACGTPGKE